MKPKDEKHHLPVANAGQNGSRATEEITQATVRFVGDSGDGMQLTGTEFTRAAAMGGNDLATFPDYPAEIRAPSGTLAGVSGFQIHFSSEDIFTPGDRPDVLVAMNPAALRTNIDDLVPGGTLIVNADAFTKNNLSRAGYDENPLDGKLTEIYRVHPIAIAKQTSIACEGLGLSAKMVARCKNFWALGLMFWLYNRDTEPQIAAIKAKFGKKAEIAEANIRAFKAGHIYGETTEMFASSYVVPPAKLPPGTYRNVMGNQATALGFVAASQKTGVDLFLGSYPITPASDILHDLSVYRRFGVVTLQCEDEIAAITSSIGAAFAGKLAVTTTSGPGLALKGEAIGLAVMTELPLVIVNVQRGGPSTGLPTKTEQSDLMQAMFGRNGECPVPILAARSPADCFEVPYESMRIAVKYMTPVLMMTDGYLGNGAEPWRIPEASELSPFEVKYRTEAEGFFPYQRDPKTLARPWAIPGTAGLEHRVGGLEKHHLTGAVSHDPHNHERMVRTRAKKVAGIQQEIPPTEILGEPSGKLLVIGWGGTYGAITQAVRALQTKGASVSAVHPRFLFPLPPDLGDILKRFDQVLVPEINMGQLAWFLRAEYRTDVLQLNKIQGKPFQITEISARIEEILENKKPATPFTVIDEELDDTPRVEGAA